MSIESWKQEFYPVHAFEVKNGKKAIHHSLKKWEGLLVKNLRHHQVGYWGEYVGEEPLASEDDLFINSETCALCVVFFNDVESINHPCESCPLYKTRGAVACDETRKGEERSPYVAAVNELNIRPMLYWLRKTAKQYG